MECPTTYNKYVVVNVQLLKRVSPDNMVYFLVNRVSFSAFTTVNYHSFAVIARKDHTDDTGLLTTSHKYAYGIYTISSTTFHVRFDYMYSYLSSGGNTITGFHYRAFTSSTRLITG